MNKNRRIFVFFLLSGILLLFRQYNGDHWAFIKFISGLPGAERVVVARLAKSQQDGLFSSGGLLGLVDSQEGWKFGSEIANHQYEIYQTGQAIQSYLVYKSHPGFQGVIFGLFDILTNFPPTVNLKIFGTSVAFVSSIVIALIAAVIAVEFGWLAGTLVLLFAVISEWMIIPAGNLYWNLWAFYLPFVYGIFMLANASKRKNFLAWKIYFAVFSTILIKILFTGFEIITTALVMSTVPFVYFATRDKWGWKLLAKRSVILGSVLALATIAGLGILILQITASEGSLSSGVEYVTDTFNRRAAGNPDDYKGIYAESLRSSHLVVIKKYLNSYAMVISTGEKDISVAYWHLIVIFGLFTALYLFKHRIGLHINNHRTGIALLISTWYSIAAPLSWYIIFKATSYIHTNLFPLAWQMPFVLLGFALCGYVIQDMFKKETI